MINNPRAAQHGPLAANLANPWKCDPGYVDNIISFVTRCQIDDDASLHCLSNSIGISRDVLGVCWAQQDPTGTSKSTFRYLWPCFLGRSFGRLACPCQSFPSSALSHLPTTTTIRVICTNNKWVKITGDQALSQSPASPPPIFCQGPSRVDKDRSFVKFVCDLFSAGKCDPETMVSRSSGDKYRTQIMLSCRRLPSASPSRHGLMGRRQPAMADMRQKGKVRPQSVQVCSCTVYFTVCRCLTF